MLIALIEITPSAGAERVRIPTSNRFRIDADFPLRDMNARKDQHGGSYAASHAVLADRCDWRKAEARLNALPQFITNIDELDIQFGHVRSRRSNALPLIKTHSWPGKPELFAA